MNDIVNKIDSILPEKVEWKRVIRQGKVIRKLICPAGFKAKGGKCVKMSPQETIKRKKSSKIAQRKLQHDPGKVKKMERKKAISLRKRAMRIPDKATKPGGQHKEG